MRLNWVLITALLTILLGCQKIRYEYLDLTDTSFNLTNINGSAVLRGDFGEEIDGVIAKASPYDLLISFSFSSSTLGDEADWSLENLSLMTRKQRKIIPIPIDHSSGKLVNSSNGGKRLYFTFDDLNLPHEQLQVRFLLIGPDGFSAPIEVIFEPVKTSDESYPLIDRIMSV